MAGDNMRRILRTREAAAYIGFAKSTLEKLRLTGGGPRFVKIGTRAVGYALDDLDDFINGRRRASTSDAGIRNQCDQTQAAAS
jgi:predicted DNA-binding transcriptional regulator AlpA